MLLKVILAALAAMPVVIAQEVTSTSVLCITSFGYRPLPSGTTLTTYYNYETTTNHINITYTSRTTVTVTPTATNLTNVVTTTVLVTEMTTSTPAPTTIPTPANFLPLLAFVPAGPTAVSRFKRYDVEGRDAYSALQILRRQTPAGNTAGFTVARNGSTSNLYRRMPRQVNCRVAYTINNTTTTTVTGAPETVYADVATATAVAISTVTVSSTTTLTAVLPRRSVYAACQANNIVNSVEGLTGEPLIFYQVVYRPTEGFPAANELITNTTCAEECCIECQTTPFCAGSFFVPSDQQCHLRLTQPRAPTYPTLPGAPYGNVSYPLINATYPLNSTYPINATYPMGNSTLLPPSTASGIIVTLPTGTSPASPLSTASKPAGTCAKGSRELYLGSIMGVSDFPLEYALAMSNGPCGRFSVWPIPVNTTASNPTVSGAPMKARGIGY